ncbi:ribonuclease H1-like [Gigantopelta aegis]|uniref:ribonuclease H1-like n=1 Tax=Gigantopelta aegis TaxID=1735272 RepID=UPI001B889EC5|nr:ribonuclease H1-like [Gigantopelta aegis]
MVSTPIKDIEQLTHIQPLNKRREAKMMIHAEKVTTEKYPSEAWIHVYTDGSATSAVSNGGAGIHIDFPCGDNLETSVATGLHCTNYRAETEALIQAASIIQHCTEDCQQVVFLTDALSVLEAIETDKLRNLSTKLQQITKTRQVVLQWIPAHCGILGNEKADTLDKKEQAKNSSATTSNSKRKTPIIKAIMRSPKNKDSYHLLTRQQQVTLFRLRTGHNRLNSHMHRKFRLASSPICTCGQEDQTTEHILHRSPQQQKIREEIWPHKESLATKLYNNKKDLERTMLFVV